MSRSLAAVLVLALAVRVALALYLGNDVRGYSGANDEITYSTLGQRLASGHGLTFPEPWYPWIQADAPQSYFSAAMSLYLGAVYTLFGYQPVIARLITAVLSTSIVGVLMLLSRRLFGDRIAVVSGIVAACYSYLVFYGVTLVTETPFMLGVISAIYMAYVVVEQPSKRMWVLLGIAVATSILFRMAVVFYTIPLLTWVFVRLKQHRERILIPILITVLFILPFTIRNYLTWGQFLLLESQFGHVFWNGNHPDQHGDFHPFVVFPIPPEVLSSHNDVLITNSLLRLGLENVRHDPMNFILLTVTRLREFFKFWPTADSDLTANALRVTSVAVLLPFATLGLILSRQRWRELMPLLLFLVIHTGVYSITWTMIRYRVPLDALLIPFAVLAAQWVAARFVAYGPASTTAARFSYRQGA